MSLMPSSAFRRASLGGAVAASALALALLGTGPAFAAEVTEPATSESTADTTTATDAPVASTAPEASTSSPATTSNEEPLAVPEPFVVEKESYTQAETVNGVNWQLTGLKPDLAWTLTISGPVSGSIEGVTDADGNASQAIYYQETVNDEPTGTNLEFPVGTYELTLNVSYGESAGESFTASFEVVGEPETTEPVETTIDPTTTAPSTTDATTAAPAAGNSGHPDALATTGADSILPIGIGASLVLLAGAGALVLARRKTTLGDSE